MPSSHRGSHKSRGVGSAVVRFFGISGVIVLGGYGAFVVLVEHCRSMSAPGTSDYLEDFASQTQVRSLQNGRSEHHESTGCKLAQVISSRKALGPDAKLGATFLIGGDSILHTAEIGLQIVTVDPLTQVTTKRQLYKPWETSDAAVMEQDLAALPTGYVVLASLQGASEVPKKRTLEALRRLGATAPPLDLSAEEIYVLIGVVDRPALAESQGSRAAAQGLLPCYMQSAATAANPTAAPVRIVVAPPAPAPLVAAASPPPMLRKPLVPKAKPASSKSWWQAAFGNPGEDKLEDKFTTSWYCIGESSHNRSCYFRNIYYTDAGFTMFSVGNPRINNLDVKRANKYEGTWRPRVESFPSAARIKDHLEKKTVIQEKGLSLYFHPLFHHNIGHGIFDGLYPAFVALVKFGLQDQPVRPIVAVTSDCFDEFAPGQLAEGDIVETYLKDPKYGRSLRTSHAKITKFAQDNRGPVSCSFRDGLDNAGLDLGAQPAGTKESCCQICAKTFGCLAGVLFANLCYLKGKCPHGVHCDVPKPERILCKLPPRGPEPDIQLRPLSKKEEEPKAETTVPVDWVVGKVRRRCKTEGIFEKFGQTGDIRRLFEMERDVRAHPQLVLHFEELVVGSGGVGNLIADVSGGIAGSMPPLNAMALFRDRMLASYDLPVPGEGMSNVERSVPPATHRIYAIIIQNKRFNFEDSVQIQRALKKLDKKGDIKAELIDWGSIGGISRSFKEHLRKVQEADVYVSSIGTALQYVPFMRDGGIYIALGSVWMRSNQYFPTFMESQLAGGGTPFLRTLYADPGAVLRKKLSHPSLGEDGYFASVNGSLLVELLYRAQELLRTGFRIPVPPYENLGVEGKILLELCDRDPKACAEMNDLRNYQYECAVLLWPECIVYEVGPWRQRCRLNRPLLRELRQKHGIPGYGAPELT
mmetsp:Transcript_61899/g.117179  ORF Transcript_61899/g.117179 Transcript_61899/m.117179 type:complete len:925 (-) Transcript_61899:2-2776(-)